MDIKKFIALILIFGAFSLYYQDEETDASNNVDVSVNLILHSFKYLGDINTLDYSSLCPNSKNICPEKIIFDIYIIEVPNTAIQTYSKTILSIFDPIGKFNGSITDVFLIDSSLYKIFAFQSRVRNSDGIDFWANIDTNTFGTYEFNEFLGYIGVAEIGVKFYLKPIMQIRRYATMIITISNLHFLINQCVGNMDCGKTNNDMSPPKAVSLTLSGNVSQKTLWEYDAFRRYIPTDKNIKVGVIAPIKDQEINKRDVNFTLLINLTLDGTVIMDEIEISNINIRDDKQSLNINNITGKSKNFGLDAQIKYYCNGFVGINCEFTCNSTEKVTSCRPSDGKIYCINGAEDPPTCVLSKKSCSDIICLNNGTCINEYDKYYCSCLKGFIGPNCEINLCQRDCFGGTCDKDNNCICNENFQGISCENSNCTDTETHLCNNNGFCTKIRDTVQCSCHFYAEGPSCSIFKCDPKCIKGTCAYNNDSMSKVKCVCDQNYDGDLCDKLNFDAVLYISEICIYSFLALAFLFLIALKFLLGFILRNVYGKQKIYQLNASYAAVANQSKE